MLRQYFSVDRPKAMVFRVADGVVVLQTTFSNRVSKEGIKVREIQIGMKSNHYFFWNQF